MDQNTRVGVTVAGLGVAIALSLAAISSKGEPYIIWADLFFGILASGLLILGLRLIRSRQA